MNICLPSHLPLVPLNFNSTSPLICAGKKTLKENFTLTTDKKKKQLFTRKRVQTASGFDFDFLLKFRVDCATLVDCLSIGFHMPSGLPSVASNLSSQLPPLIIGHRKSVWLPLISGVFSRLKWAICPVRTVEVNKFSSDSLTKSVLRHSIMGDQSIMIANDHFQPELFPFQIYGEPGGVIVALLGRIPTIS